MGCSASTRRNAIAKDQPVSHNRGIIAPQEQKLKEREQREASGKYGKLSKKHSKECKIEKQMEEKQIKEKSKLKTTPVKVRRGSLSSISSSSSEEDDYSPASVDMKKIEAQNSHAVVTIPIASNILTQDECLDTDEKVELHQETIETPEEATEICEGTIKTHEETVETHEVPTETHKETIETHEEASETREETIETHEETVETHEVPTETHEETIETHKEASETREETIETHKEASETHEEPTETHEETIETHKVASETHEEPTETHGDANQATSTSTELFTVTECQEPPEKVPAIQDIEEVIASDEVEMKNGDVLVVDNGEETKTYDELVSNQKEECIQEVNDKNIESTDPTDAVVEGEAREQAVKNDQEQQEGGGVNIQEQHVDTSSNSENHRIVGEKNDEAVNSGSLSNVLGDPIEKVSEMNAAGDTSDGNVNNELSSAVSAHEEDETAEECTGERNEDDTKNDAMKLNKDETNGTKENISVSLEEGLEINTRPTSNLEVAGDGEGEEEA